jgi:hypothetical protein
VEGWLGIELVSDPHHNCLACPMTPLVQLMSAEVQWNQDALCGRYKLTLQSGCSTQCP